MLTFKELKGILDKEGISEDSYDINSEGSISCKNGYAIKKAKKGYYLYIVDDGDYELLNHLETEDEICRCFIRWLFGDDNPYYFCYTREYKEEYSAEFLEAERKWLQGLKKEAAKFEVKHRQEGISKRMTFEELKYILVKENISPYSWDILGHAYVKGYDGYVIKEAENGYDLYYIERGQYTFLEHTDDEHSACMAFLKLFIKDGDVHLAKHLSFDELLDDSRLVEPSSGDFDLMSAIALSKQLRRPLSDEESKQFYTTKKLNT